MSHESRPFRSTHLVPKEELVTVQGTLHGNGIYSNAGVFYVSNEGQWIPGNGYWTLLWSNNHWSIVSFNSL